MRYRLRCGFHGSATFPPGGIIRESLRAAREFAIDLVYPKRCSGCERRGSWVCDVCSGQLHQFDRPWCARCGVPERYGRCACESTPEILEQVRSVGPFDGWIRGAVIQFKYHGEWARTDHLAEPLARIIADLQPFDVLIPVPLHPARLRHRGFNQSLLIAERAAAHLGVEVQDGLIRTRRTDAQVTLGSDQRLANVFGAFAVRRSTAFRGLSVVLIDDVITTGSTLSACAEALSIGGASVVKAATIAREM